MALDIDNDPLISIIIPNRNGHRTIGTCLKSIFDNIPDNRFEVIVSDDCSTDGSADIIHNFPCTLITHSSHVGASGARNSGARAARGKYLFFIDSDCVLVDITLDTAIDLITNHPDSVIGGTYTLRPYDRGFFSSFQSSFINYSETKNTEPDYVATHTMLISKELFHESGGFNEKFMPILEDVEYSHRVRDMGMKLIMSSSLQVMHIFNYGFFKSLKNAYRKSRYWTAYSVVHKNIHIESGTSSVELKSTVLMWAIAVPLMLYGLIYWSLPAIISAKVLFLSNAFICRRLIASFYRAGGLIFTVFAFVYFGLLYPLPVATGGITGAVIRHHAL